MVAFIEEKQTHGETRNRSLPGREAPCRNWVSRTRSRSSRPRTTRSIGTTSGFDAWASGSGHPRTYVLSYRPAALAKERRIKLGLVDEISLTEARKRATTLKAEVYQGLDPLRERRSNRTQPTFADTFALHKKHHFPKMSPLSARQRERTVERLFPEGSPPDERHHDGRSPAAASPARTPTSHTAPPSGPLVFPRPTSPD